MNLWFRFLKVVLFSRFSSSIAPLDQSSIDFRVWPGDLDVLRHMNNGRYLTLMDLGRVDLMIRAGLAQKLDQAGYYPVVAEEVIRFRRSLSPFQKFTLKSQVVGWDDKFFFMRQEFHTIEHRVAVAYIKARFLKKSGGSVTPLEILEMGGLQNPQVLDPELIKAWSGLGPFLEKN